MGSHIFGKKIARKVSGRRVPSLKTSLRWRGLGERLRRENWMLRFGRQTHPTLVTRLCNCRNRENTI